MTWLVVGLTGLAGVTAAVPALAADTFVHTPYLGGFMDLPSSWLSGWGNVQPDNALTVAWYVMLVKHLNLKTLFIHLTWTYVDGLFCSWIIHISSLVEFLVAMGFAWRWADVVDNEKWKGVTWGLLPLHSSGITACIYHVFYNGIPLMVPIQAFLTCIGNTTAAYATYRLAISNGWRPSGWILNSLNLIPGYEVPQALNVNEQECKQSSKEKSLESASLVGFEDLGEALASDTDYTFLIKLFAGCALASYLVKYGELVLDFPFSQNLALGVALVLLPSALNAFKWYKRSQDPTFEGWF